MCSKIFPAKEDLIGRACGTHEGEKKWVHGFGGENLNGSRTLGRTGGRWEDTSAGKSSIKHFYAQK